jgi:hypothetical protein
MGDIADWHFIQMLDEAWDDHFCHTDEFEDAEYEDDPWPVARTRAYWFDHETFDCGGNFGFLTRAEAVTIGIWIPVSGHAIPIRALDDTHLINTMKFIKRKIDAVPPAMQEEYDRRNHNGWMDILS